MASHVSLLCMCVKFPKYTDFKQKFIEVIYSLQFSVWKVTLEAARGECQQVTKFIMKYMRHCFQWLL